MMTASGISCNWLLFWSDPSNLTGKQLSIAFANLRQHADQTLCISIPHRNWKNWVMMHIEMLKAPSISSWQTRNFSASLMCSWSLPDDYLYIEISPTQIPWVLQLSQHLAYPDDYSLGLTGICLSSSPEKKLKINEKANPPINSSGKGKTKFMLQVI